MFNNLQNDYQDEMEVDSLGGGGPLESDIYHATITKAYAEPSKNGAMGLHLEFEVDGGKSYRESLYVTNKNGDTFYERDGKKRGLPGFLIADAMCLCATGMSLSEQSSEEKVIPVYDFDAQKEVPTPKQVITSLMGQKVSLAIQKVEENKQALNQSTNKYEPTAEIRAINRIDRVFHTETMMTVGEARQEMTQGEFHEKWLEKYQGVTINRVKDVAAGRGSSRSRAGTASNGGAGSTGAKAAAPTKSLFGGK